MAKYGHLMLPGAFPDKVTLDIDLADETILREKGGKETESEYFAALLTTLEATTEGEESILAIVYLLSLVIKKVPTNLLKAKFPEASKLFISLLEKYHADGRGSLIMALIECMGTLLQAQEGALWMESSTVRSYEILLTFAINTKPKVRKTTHASLKSVIKVNLANHKNHPVVKTAAAFINKVLAQCDPETTTTTHHALNFLKQCLQFFSGEHLKGLCESILRTMSSNNLIIKTNAMETLHSLFVAYPPEENLSVDLNGKLISALYDFQPSVNDIHVAEAWMCLMSAAHSNLALLDGGLCLKALPKFYGTLLTYFQSEHREVAVSSANVMKETSEKCLEPYQDLVKSDIECKNSAVFQIFKIIESGMNYKFQPVWDIVLESLRYLYLTYGKICASKIISGVGNLIDLHDLLCNSNVSYTNDLNKAVGAAFTEIGPKLILDERPLSLVRDDNVCEFHRAWMLPLMKDCIRNTELQYFISYFLPMAAQLREKGLKCREQNQDLEAKVYETLQSQAFKNIAKILGTALTKRNELRPIVLQAFRTLINKTQDEEELKVIGHFSKNYLPILFNLYTSDKEECKAVSLSVLETIKLFLVITDEEDIQGRLYLLVLRQSVQPFLDFSHEVDSCFYQEDIRKIQHRAEIQRTVNFILCSFLRNLTTTHQSFSHRLMDLAICMVKYSSEDLLDHLFAFAVQNLKSTDRRMQKKSYRIIEEISESNSDTCKSLVQNRFDELKSLLANSLSTAVPSSKASRLQCISSLVKKLDVSQKDFIHEILPEVILCTKEVGVKVKTKAFDLLTDIGNTLVFLSPQTKEDCIEEYFQLVMAGLAGSPHMISATLLAFTKLVFQYRDCISTQLVATLLDSAITLLKSKTREVIKSSLCFIRAVVRILDENELVDHLERLVKNLFVWNANIKNAYRQQIRVILEKLDKKCGYQLVRSLVPDPHKKFIIQIHKTMLRTKKQKEARRNSPLEDEKSVIKKGARWEDIFVDSDEEQLERKEKKKKENSKKKDKVRHPKSWIVEGEDTVDLLDPKISKNITATEPSTKQRQVSTKKEDFSVSSDGKFIIKDEEENIDENNAEKSLDIGRKDILAGFEKTPKQIKLGKRRHLEDMPEDDGMRLGYQPGGRGIHRKRDEDDPKMKKSGEEYRAKKARGDMKRKGKPDPYAYIPLDKQMLNKRKRAKLAGQYCGIMKAARKGAVKGGKFKRRK